MDTAGLRRQAKIDESVEYYSFVRAMRAIDRADVALLIVDASEGVTDGDQRVARFAQERGCAMVVLLNKWDLLADDEARDDVLEQVPSKLGFVGYAPVLRIIGADRPRRRPRARGGRRRVRDYTQEISTSALNRFLTELREIGHTVIAGGAQLRVKLRHADAHRAAGVHVLREPPEARRRELQAVP